MHAVGSTYPKKVAEVAASFEQLDIRNTIQELHATQLGRTIRARLRYPVVSSFQYQSRQFTPVQQVENVHETLRFNRELEMGELLSLEHD